MKMRIKKDFLLCFLPIIVVLCFVLLSPAFAFKKVNECELARTNASLTGLPATTRCPPTPADEGPDCEATRAFERCTTLLSEEEPAVNGDSLSSVHDDYGSEWLQNLNAAGDLYGLHWDEFGLNWDLYGDSAVISPLTVESGYCGGFCGVDSEYVRIGLGSQEVSLDSKDIKVTMGSKAAAIAGQDQILGTIYLAGMTVKTHNSYVSLCLVDGKTAIYSQVDVTIDRIDLATLSWGDADGCQHDGAGNTGKAGYVGIKDTIINTVTASGSVSIDVGKIIDDQELSIAHSVHIGIDNMNVGMASLDTTIVLGDKKDFSGTKYILGTLYMKDLKMSAGGYLDIYNPANNDKATSLGFGLKVPLLTLDTLSWGDSDGFGGATAAGFVGLRNLAINNLAIAGVTTIQTITVQAGDTSTNLPAGTALVRIGFRNLDVSMDSLNTDVALGPAKGNLNQVLGSVYLGGLKAYINGSVDIHTPSQYTQGIVFDLNLSPSNITAAALSWGDADGVGGMTTAGFRGWRNMGIVGLKVAGKVEVDVATVDATVTPGSAEERMSASYKIPQMSPSFVHIGIGTGNANDDPALPGALAISMTSLSWDVVLDSSRSLDSPNASVLRSFYISGMEARLNGWVHIGAH
jgi:hypothetical protein